MPALHPCWASAVGIGPDNDFVLAAPYSSVVGICKFPLSLLDALLSDDAAGAKKALAETKPAFASKAEFFQTIDKMFLDKQAVTYNDDGTVKLEFSAR